MSCNKEITLDAILDRIDSAAETELDSLLQELIRRHHRLRPDTELMAVFIPRSDPIERKRMWLWFLDYLEKYE